MTAGATIWTAAPGPGFTVEAAADLLSVAERRRVREIAAPAVARAFAFRRAGRRALLASRLGAAPEIAASADGKPMLGSPHQNWAFSASEARPWLVLALCLGGALGVDAEPRDRKIRAAALSPRLFTAAERGDWDAADTGDVLALWTAKEAVVKAAGGGLTLDRLQAIEVGAAGPDGWRAARIGAEVWRVLVLRGAGPLVISLAARRALAVELLDGGAVLRAAGIDAI